MDRASIEALARRGPEGTRVWVVVERDGLVPPFVGPRARALVAFVDRAAAETYASELGGQRVWLEHRVEPANLGFRDGAPALVPASTQPGAPSAAEVLAALEREPDPALLDPERRRLRCAWRSLPWPSSALESAVWLDVLDDELVWWGARHEKGDHEFVTREPVTAFLERSWVSEEAPPGLLGEITEALRRHRAPGADRDPSLSARRGALAKLRVLLAEGASIEHRDLLGRTPLAAALTGPAEPVALHLLAAGASLVDAIAWCHGEAARGDALALGLEVALRRGFWALALALMERGAPVDAPRPARAWEIALSNGAPVALLEAMKARGARLDPASGVWASRRFLTFAWRTPALAALSPVPLPAPPAPPPARAPARARPSAHKERARTLGLAVAAGDLAAVDRALAAGATVSDVGFDGLIAIHHVSEAPPERQAALVAHLLAAGAKIDAADRSGATALAKAVRRGALAATEALLAAGASSAVRDEGTSLVAHAVIGDHPAILERLLAAGASPAGADRHGKTAIELAVARRRTACEAILRRAMG